MSRKYWFIFIWIYAFLPIFASAEDFQIAKDGSIKVNGINFSDSASYLKSAFFKENGMRCGTKSPLVNTVSSATTAKSVSHCILALTSIQEEY
ncbi:MAG TPA: hypothetical protein EYH36_05105 [Desulfocapsa sulfexigens]|nr:hypothetical protein [Desulfocapsa sulfexigens]